MEWWNYGMMGLKKTRFKAHILLQFSYLSGVFYGAKAENGCLGGIIIKCRFNIFCRIDFFPLFIPTILSEA
jgi:hypothetical protein